MSAMKTVPRDQSIRPSERSKMRSVAVTNDGGTGFSRGGEAAVGSEVSVIVMT